MTTKQKLHKDVSISEQAQHFRALPRESQPEDSSEQSAFAARVEHLTKQAGSAESLARKSGLSPRVIYKYRNENAEPSRDRLIALARAGGVSVEWLATGEGPMEPRAAGIVGEGTSVDLIRESPGAGYVTTPPSEGYVALPRYDVRAAAGVGLPVVSEEIADFVYFKADWLRRTLGINPANLALIEASGSSMAPEITDGDLLLVDLDAAAPLRENGIYVVGFDDALQVKRVSRKPGRLLVESANPEYQSSNFEVELSAVGDFRIVGRVVWAGGRI